MLARRTETIRLILDGAPMGPAAASRRLGYSWTARHRGRGVGGIGRPPHGALESTAVLPPRPRDPNGR